MLDRSPSTFPDIAAELLPPINGALESCLQLDAECPDKLREAMSYSLLSAGKRLRPMLVLMAAEACGCQSEEALPAACAVEMIHCYSLIHDDLPCMDDDDLRRGRPTCHIQYDEATAILAGDALLAHAFRVLSTGIADPTIAVECCRELSLAAGPSQLVGGQVDDLSAENQQGNLERLERIHRRKTGAMFRVSLRLGGLVARANDEQLERLEAYGTKLGLAFQIVDDLLDYAGSDEDMGKRTGKDSQHGKLTFPALLGEEASRHRAKDLIEEAGHAAEYFEPNSQKLMALAQFVLERNQ